MSENAIPVMDDPLGRYWQQPSDVRSAPMDDEHVILTAEQVAQLLEYSASFPTGIYPGKCWIRREGSRTFLAWYGEETPQRTCPILFRDVLLED